MKAVNKLSKIKFGKNYYKFSLLCMMIVVFNCSYLYAENIEKGSVTDQSDLIIERIEINEATLEQLCSLPRIGIKKAKRIISYREKHRFTRITQLLNIQGIGSKTLKNFRHMIYIRPKIKKK